MLLVELTVALVVASCTVTIIVGFVGGGLSRAALVAILACIGVLVAAGLAVLIADLAAPSPHVWKCPFGALWVLALAGAALDRMAASPDSSLNGRAFRVVFGTVVLLTAAASTVGMFVAE